MHPQGACPTCRHPGGATPPRTHAWDTCRSRHVHVSLCAGAGGAAAAAEGGRAQGADLHADGAHAGHPRGAATALLPLSAARPAPAGPHTCWRNPCRLCETLRGMHAMACMLERWACWSAGQTAESWSMRMASRTKHPAVQGSDRPSAPCLLNEAGLGP